MGELDDSVTSKIYRDPRLTVRTPTDGNFHFDLQQGFYTDKFLEMQREWSEVAFAQPCYGGEPLTWRQDHFGQSKPGESLYVASAGLNRASYLDGTPAPRPHLSGEVEFMVRAEQVAHLRTAFFGDEADGPG